MFFLEYLVSSCWYAVLLGTRVVTRGINSPNIVLFNLPNTVGYDGFLNKDIIIPTEQVFLTCNAALYPARSYTWIVFIDFDDTILRICFMVALE